MQAAATKNVTLPVPSEGLGNWAALVGRICQAAAGGAGPDAANACLTSYFNHTNHKLESLVSCTFPEALHVSCCARTRPLHQLSSVASYCNWPLRIAVAEPLRPSLSEGSSPVFAQASALYM